MGGCIGKMSASVGAAEAVSPALKGFSKEEVILEQAYQIGIDIHRLILVHQRTLSFKPTWTKGKFEAGPYIEKSPQTRSGFILKVINATRYYIDTPLGLWPIAKNIRSKHIDITALFKDIRDTLGLTYCYRLKENDGKDTLELFYITKHGISRFIAGKPCADIDSATDCYKTDDENVSPEKVTTIWNTFCKRHPADLIAK